MTFYSDSLNTLIASDTFEYLTQMQDNGIDVIIADPPYFLSNDGISNSGGKMISVNKGEWDKNNNISAEDFYRKFLDEAYRVLKPNGTIWLFGTMHNIYLLGYLLPKYDFKLLNNITWQKSNPVPNLSCRMFTHSTETILWAKKSKGKHLFNYSVMKEMNENKQMKDVWTTPTINRSEKRFGKHPTQKPLSLMIRILQASAKENDVILDPFVGSGTSMVAGTILNMKTIGIDNSTDYLDIAKKRIIDFKNEKIGKIK